MQATILVAEQRRAARIGVMRALNRHVERSFNLVIFARSLSKIRPRISPEPTRFVPFPKNLFLRMRVRSGRMFVSLFTMLVSRSRVVLGIFMFPARMVMFGLMMMMRCCVVMSGGIVMMLLRGMLRRLCHLWGSSVL